MTGTLVAQLVSYLMYPLITRIYSTVEMGELGLYMRWVAFIAAIATARYEVALPMPKRDHHAYLLYRLALRISYIVIAASTLFAAVYFIVTPTKLSVFLILLLAVLSAYLTVWMNLGIHWSIRNKKFKSISSQRIINSLSVNSLRWIFGIFGFGTIGLIVATVIGTFLSILVFIRDFLRFKPSHQAFANKKKMLVVAREYKDFPAINLPQILMDLGVDLAIAGLIVVYFDKGIFGSYSHAFLMLKLPLSVIGQSFGQVFFNRCTEMLNRGESIYMEVLRMAKVLLLIAIVPFTILFFFGEPIFGFVFGKQWFESGRFAEILAPYLMINFVVSPLSILPIILKRQKEAFFIALVFGLIRLINFGLLPLILAGETILGGNVKLETSFEEIIIIDTIVMSIGLIVVFFLYLRYAARWK
jgi:O-antigen/teichoic acid export membrane protein